jgi:hypothetical protein
MPWQSNWKACTRAFDEWRLVDKDIRAYLRFGLSVAEEAYDEIWEKAANEPSDGEGPELPDVFHQRVDGIWPHDFQWMFLVGGLKDSVTAYEVYLEKAMEEVLQHNGFTIAQFTDEHSLSWGRLERFYHSALGLSIENVDVKRVRNIRHILVHKRGELRTEDQRTAYGSVGDFGLSRDIRLELDETLGLMDILASSVSTVDPIAWESSWGQNPSSQLTDYLVAQSS